MRTASDSNREITSSISSGAESFSGRVSARFGSPLRNDGPLFVKRSDQDSSTVHRTTQNIPDTFSPTSIPGVECVFIRKAKLSVLSYTVHLVEEPT